MFNRILVPVEVLDAQHPLLLTARDVFPQAEIHILHVLLPFAPSAANALRYAAMPEIDHAHAQLQSSKAELQAIGAGEVVLSATLATAVTEQAINGQFDLIMMGTSTKTLMEKQVLGSVTTATVRYSPVPVLTMGRRFPEQRTFQPQRVLVLQDFSPAVQHATQLTQKQFPHAVFDMLHVLPHGTARTANKPQNTTYSSLQLRRQHRIMDSQQRLNHLGGGKLVEGHPAEVALEHASTGNYDLIVMGTSSKGTLENFFFGSVAQQVVTESPIPVLTARATEHTETAS